MIHRALSRRKLLGLGAVAGMAPLALGAEAGPNPLAGRWTYRSFLNNPDPNTPFGLLQFAVADLSFEKTEFGRIEGRLSFDNDHLKLTGTIAYGNPFSVRFQGVGATPGTIEQGNPWIYDYQGYVAPAWPNGVDQRPAVVGTIVRTVSHSQGRAKAGVVASWIAVRKDDSTPAPVDPSQLIPKLETAWAAAVLSNQADEIAKFLADDFFFIGPRGALQSRDEHLDDFRKGRLVVKKMTIKDASNLILWDGSATIDTLASVVLKHGDQEISADYRFLDSWRSEGSVWRAVARQQTKVEGT